jgi:hypothetical protein
LSAGSAVPARGKSLLVRVKRPGIGADNFGGDPWMQ